ncbi:glycosyltransferase family 2 protein [Helicobacter sp. MIT 14-3879]|uniref:glycosyltransferase family 2 protein n=1 Tax=Helicobacter sp. MIT 14-3879 TaxID=2040649 RepID=UPI000E1F6157|nr:glycosyltransferase family 2 protein [Helicobacter sp. MIT 14-3879]RDU63158.1 glycosyl transferase [Helicobacter sp. MIT 14-3879]
MLKISIITPSYNSKETILLNLDSVLSQDYKFIEHIIIDNKSNDGTLELLQRYKDKYNKKYTFKIVSEKDSGIYHAMNKGISLSSGDIIGFLNSDDFFANSNIVSIIAWGFAKPTKPQIIYADICYINNNFQVIRKLKGKSYNKASFKFGFHPAHPSFYVKKEVFNKYGNFNINYKISADYELMLRFLYKNNISSLYIDETFVKMKVGGISNRNIKNIIKANIECAKSWRDNNLSRFPIFIILKLVSKLQSIRYKNIFRWGGVEPSYNILYINYSCSNYLNFNNSFNEQKAA